MPEIELKDPEEVSEYVAEVVVEVVKTPVKIADKLFRWAIGMEDE